METALMRPWAPDNPWVPDLWQVTSRLKECEGTFTLALRPLDVMRSVPKPGQFHMLYRPGQGEIPVSISSFRADAFYHTIRSVGLVSAGLARLDVGATLGIRGPFGSHWPLDAAAGKHLLLIAGGLGLAPLRPAIEYARDHPGFFQSVHVLYGARDPQLLIFRDDFKLWEQAGIQVDMTVDNAFVGWPGAVGTLPQLLGVHSSPRDGAVAFICGPEIMMRLSADKLVAQGMAATAIYLSLERNMKCAMGFCGHCQFGPAFLCREGPILRYDRISALMKVKQL